MPVWLRVIGWLLVFFSPSGYFFGILLADRFQIPSPPESVVWLLFVVIPVVALVICEWVVWLHSKTVARKITLMVFTLLGMLLQFGVMVVILRAILVARIAYLQ